MDSPNNDSPITGSSLDHSHMQDSQTPLRPSAARKNTPRFTEEPSEISTESANGGGRPSGVRKRTKTSSLALTRPISRTLTLPQIKSALFQPKHTVGTPPTVVQSIVAILRSSWVNLLLVFIPVSWGLHFGLPKDFANRDTLVFVFSFLAIIPLASLLAFATEDVSLRVGQTLAGLMSATLGNAVELIVSIIALTHCELQVVQSSLIGSILSNLLLVLGMCFFAGGLKYSEQGFGAMTTQINSSLLVIAVIAVLLPGAFSFSSTQADEKKDILHMSHGVALILLFVYGGYLVFQLYSHATMYGDESGDIAKSTKYEPRKSKKKEGETDAEGGDQHEEEEEEEVEEPQMTTVAGIVLLVVVTVLVALTAEWLVDSIDGMTKSAGISKEFVGIILLPIVGNAAEHVTAITVSVKDKLNLSLQVAVGSSIQIALFVIPFIVTLAWIIGKPLSMLFDPYESIALFLAVITVNYVVQDGKSNWLEGLILMCLYVILAVTFWYYQPSSPATCEFLTEAASNSTLF